MERRRFLQIALSLSLSSGTLLAGCGGGGGGEDGETRRVSGDVLLPAGFSLPLADLTAATALGGEALQPGGVFSVRVSAQATSPTLAWVQTAGRAMLFGFVDDQNRTLDARSTAVALLYFALGGYTIPSAHKRTLLDLIQAEPAVAALIQTIADRVAANPFALDDGDAAFGAALKTAVDAILAGRPASRAVRMAPAPARSVTRQATGSEALLLLTPDGLHSNVEVVQATAAQSFLATNHGRRYCRVRVYETGKIDENGTRTDYPKVKIVGPPVSLTSTRALGIFSTLFGLASGQTAFVPISTDPIRLEMASDAVRTFFDVVVLGSTTVLSEPGFFSDARYADELESWRSSVRNLNLISWFADIIFGLLLEIWGLHDVVVSPAAMEQAIAALRSLQVANWFHVVEAAETGDIGRATQEFLKLVSQNSDFVVKMQAALVTLSPQLRGILGKEATAASLQIILRAVSAAFAVVGVILGAGDLGAVLWDLAHAERGERWSATLVSREVRVRLNPVSATIAPGDEQALTASVSNPPDGRVVYRWNLSGNLASLRDGAGKNGVDFESDSASVTLATTPSTQGTLTITMEAIGVDGAGARTSLGTAVSTITVNDDVPFGSIRVRFTSFDPGGKNVTGETRLLTPYDDPRKQVQGNNTFVMSLHWNFKAMIGNDDSVRMVAEFPTKQIVVGSTATFRDDYGLTMKLATGPNTEVYLYPKSGTMRVTEVGVGYLGFTMDAQLVGLRGAATTATAVLRGWIAGYQE